MPMAHLKQHMERTFRQLAADKGLDFNVKFDGKLPQTIRTDEKRLQQIVLNLLSNAFKFTVEGRRHARRAQRRKGLESEPPGAAQRRARDRDRRHRYGHRHPRGQAEADLRGRSSRPTAPPAANMAAPASACRSAAKSRGCWAASCRCARSRARVRPSRCTSRSRAEADAAPSAPGTPARYDNSGAIVRRRCRPASRSATTATNSARIRSC